MMLQQRTAFVVGATGLVGKALVKQLCADSNYEKVITFSRRKLDIIHPKLVQQIASFDELTALHLVAVDDVFCCLGTTIAKAGSQEAFKKVDFVYPIKLATLAKEVNIEHFIIISAMGAKVNSRTFYMKTKGELEEALKALQLNRLSIVQPSLLTGERTEFRLGEKVGEGVLKVITPLLRGSMRKMRPISSETLATAMKKIALSPANNNVQTYLSDELMNIGK